MASASELALLIRARNDASPVLAQVQRDMGGMGKTALLAAGQVAKMAAMAGGIAAAGLGALSISAVNAASDMNESISKARVVFGDAADDIQAFASTAAQALGQSKQEALAAAGTFGNLFVSMGLGKGEAASLSKGIVTLGSDLASFNNINPAEALEKLRAGLVGEAEPLRQLGVNMNAAMVEAKALEMGLAATKDEISEAAKVQARYAIIMEQTKTAQGDFANTSTGLANAQRIISASFKDMQAQIGEGLLPLVAPLVSQFATSLPSAIQTAKGVMDGLVPTIQAVAGILGDLVSTGDLGLLADNLNEAFGVDVSPFTRALTAAIEAVQSFVAGIDVGATFGALQQAFADLAPTGERLAALFETIKTAVLSLIPSPVVDLVKGFVDTATAASDGRSALQVLTDTINGVSAAVAGVITWLKEHSGVTAVLTGIVAAGTAAYLLHTAAVIAHNAATAAVTLATKGWAAAQVILNAVLTANPIGLVITAVAGLAAGLIYAYEQSETFRTHVNAAFQAVKLAGDLMATGIGTAVTTITTAWQTGWTGISTFFSTTWSTIVTTAKDSINSIIGFINTLIGAWNALEFKIPGFSIELPSAEILGERIGGGKLRFGGETISFPDLAQIPTLDAGAIVTKPTLAMLAANAQPEAVIPLSRAGMGGGGGLQVTVNVTGGTYLGSSREVGQVLAQVVLDNLKQTLNWEYEVASAVVQANRMGHFWKNDLR